MLLSGIELDLSKIGDTVKYLLVFGLFAVSAYALIWPSIQKLLKSGPKLPRRPANSDFKREGVDRSSDTPPPKGFADHLQIVEETAPNANTQVWWEYAKAEMTEAEVAIAEAKLARQPQPPTTEG
jgi:hypothetical protein